MSLSPAFGSPGNSNQPLLSAGCKAFSPSDPLFPEPLPDPDSESVPELPPDPEDPLSPVDPPFSVDSSPPALSPDEGQSIVTTLTSSIYHCFALAVTLIVISVAEVTPVISTENSVEAAKAALKADEV